jgi:hypothetical protein
LENTILTPATDNRIDQIVYQLYGLTDKEVAVVEKLRAGLKMDCTFFD